MSTVVIIGAGHAAGQVAASLRQDGHEGAIIMLGDEPFIPYSAPLSRSNTCRENKASSGSFCGRRSFMTTRTSTSALASLLTASTVRTRQCTLRRAKRSAMTT